MNGIQPCDRTAVTAHSKLWLLPVLYVSTTPLRMLTFVCLCCFEHQLDLFVPWISIALTQIRLLANIIHISKCMVRVFILITLS